MPHGNCYLWQTSLLGLHAISDLLIALAYGSISLMLASVMLRRRNMPFLSTFALFGLFILSCGLVHLAEVWTIWHPAYWLSGTLKALTAIVSVAAALELYGVLPVILRLPDPNELEKNNQELETQIAERKKAEETLLQSASRLQQALDFESLLKRITDKVRDTLDEDHILKSAVRELGHGLHVRSCNATLYDLDSKTAIVHYEHASSTVPVQGRVISMENSPQIYTQLLAGYHFQFCSLFPNPVRGSVSMLACPIIDDQGVLGDLWLINSADHAFKDLELRLLQQVANQCAIAIRQARLYQATKAQVNELQRLNNLKDDFLSTVSHELRTPVANIKLATRMLSLLMDAPSRPPQAGSNPATTNGSETNGHAPDNEAASRSAFFNDSSRNTKATHYLKILQDECQREIGLINDLLDLQRLEANRTTLQVEPICLEDWLQQVVKPFESRATSRQQTLSLQTQSPLPIVESDSVSLGRILTELINNACKYTPPDEAIAVNVTSDQDSVRFAISNSGVEISEKEIVHIFDKFYRIPSSDPWKQGGTGLGLALVQKLTEHLEGEIQVDSRNNWTTFTVVIPHMLEVSDPVAAKATLEMEADDDSSQSTVSQRSV
ncbi:MAG: HAMP domain-containing sensor histidine kinase [Elainellaceae cyanobacterium]